MKNPRGLVLCREIAKARIAIAGPTAPAQRPTALGGLRLRRPGDAGDDAPRCDAARQALVCASAASRVWPVGRPVQQACMRGLRRQGPLRQVWPRNQRADGPGQRRCRRMPGGGGADRGDSRRGIASDRPTADRASGYLLQTARRANSTPTSGIAIEVRRRLPRAADSPRTSGGRQSGAGARISAH